MKLVIRFLAVSAIGLAAAIGAHATEVAWVAAAIHAPGVGDSNWRSDLSILNPCDEDAVVELTLHLEHGDLVESFEIAAGRQQIFEDVVAQLSDNDASGALEIRSELPVIIESRTYTTDGNATYGQTFPAAAPAAGATTGEALTLPFLRENARYRSNLLLLNTSTDETEAAVILRDLAGDEVGRYTFAIPAGTTRQDNRPYRNRFGRDDILGGSAEIVVTQGSGIFAYASVVDNATDDPLTVVARHTPECPEDVAEQLRAIPGMVSVQEVEAPSPGTRLFELYFRQPADHDNPAAGGFDQYLTLLHRSPEAPVVFRTLGYSNSLYLWNSQLTQVLDANQLFVEHRYFADSRPRPTDWSLLTIEQAAADHHAVVEAFRPIYQGPWVSTGHSKGGMAAVYHRRFYPEDVEATVAYVAPLTLGAPDLRYLDTLDSLGAPDCRDALRDVQHEILTRREIFAAMIDADYGEYLSFDRMGVDGAMDLTILEMPFGFWMGFGRDDCAWVPPPTASDQELYEFVETVYGWMSYSDQAIAFYEPYMYQAFTEEGWPAIASEHLADVLVSGPGREDSNLPQEVDREDVVYDPSVVQDIATWVSASDAEIMFVYGETDPWTTGMFDIAHASDSHVFVAAGGNHGSMLHSLSPADQAAALQLLEGWLGVTPNQPLPPDPGKVGPDGRLPPWLPPEGYPRTR